MTNFEYLLKEIASECEIREQAVIGQKCKTYDEYAAVCGEIRGLTYAADLIKTLAKQIQRSELEEEP